MVSVLPLPAPATTSAGERSASMTARCCSVGRNMPSASAISFALMVVEAVVMSITTDGPHSVQHAGCRVVAAPGFEVDDAGELCCRHRDRGLPDALTESLELLVVEPCLHALSVAFSADALLDVEQLRAAAVMFPELVEERIEHPFRVGELVGAELRMLVDGVLLGDRVSSLQVDDDHRAVASALHTVDGPADFGGTDLQFEAAFGADECLAVPLEVAQVFGHPGREDPGRPFLLLRDPGRFEEKLRPAALNRLPHGVDTRIGGVLHCPVHDGPDRQSTRLNSSHVRMSYAVFCLKKKNLLRLTPYHFPQPRRFALAERPQCQQMLCYIRVDLGE